MRLYVEALEICEQEECEPDFIRLEIDNNTMTEQEAVETIKAIMVKPYRIYRHKCYHDEDPRKPCEVELIEEVR